MHRLDVLGPPRLTRPDGSPAELALGKPFAVLVFLALTDTPPTRKELARLFWPASEARNARQSVRQTLSILRRALGPDLFQADDPVKLDPRSLETDVDRLREALEEGDVETAETLWRGPFMQEFALPDAPEWTRWVETREMALEAALVQLLAAEADVLRGRGEPDRAVGRLEKAIGIDPYREALHSALVDLHLEGGRLTKAASAIGRARELLGPDTPAVAQMAQRLERRVRRADGSENGTATATSAAAAAAAAPAEIRTELVGRTREMAVLLDAWRKSAAGSSHVVVLTGAAGIGKTRLTEELAEAAGAQGATEVRVVAERNERALEWGLIAELARKLARLPGAGDVEPSAAATLRRLSPAIPMGQQPVAGELEPTPVAGSVSALLLRVTGEQPLLIVIDEAQWVDEPSRAVLSRIARSLDGARTALVVCLQDEEAGDAGRDFIAALEHAEHPVRLRLSALSDGDVREMIALMVDLPEENAVTFRDRLARAADGNPLYLTELLRALVDEGTLVAGPEGLRLSGERLPDPLPLPSGVRELLRRRLAALSDPAIAFAAHLARLGGQAGLQEVKERSELTEGTLARAAGELLAHDVVQWSDPEIVSFTHDRLRSAVLRDFPVGANGNARRSWWQDRRVLAAGLAGIAIVSALWLSGRPGGRTAGAPAEDAPAAAIDEAPYGGGLLIGFPADSVMWEVDPRQGPPEEWTRRPPRFWYPPDIDRKGPFRLASGDTVWYVRGQPTDLPPSIVLARKDGTRTEIVRMEGDVNLPTMSPDGRYIVFAAENVSLPEYGHDLWLARADGSEAHVIFSGQVQLLNPVWSPGGRYILTSVAGEADTIIAITPAGERVAQVVVDQMSTPQWCGATDTVANLVVRGDERSILLLDVGTGEAEFRPDPDLLFTGLACSPDGSALVIDRAVDGEPVRFLQDLTTGESHEALEHTYPEFMKWIPDPGLAVPVAVRLDEGGVLDLEWGASRALTHSVLMSDSSLAANPVAWTSSDPDIVSVTEGGRVSANLPGGAWIRASLDGWLSDSLRVTVAEGRPAQLRFHETFTELSDERWYKTGEPLPVPVVLPDGPALRMLGDGLYNDGIVSRETFSVTDGATLELSFRIHLTRNSHQRLQVSLASGDPMHGQENIYPGGWSRGTVLGFSYPGTEDMRFDPSEIRTSFGTGEQRSLFLRDLLPTTDWVHLAVQVRPDGRMQLFVNHELMATSQLRVDIDPDERHRIVIQGSSVDTELYVRNVSLWKGVRH